MSFEPKPGKHYEAFAVIKAPNASGFAELYFYTSASCETHKAGCEGLPVDLKAGDRGFWLSSRFYEDQNLWFDHKGPWYVMVGPDSDTWPLFPAAKPFEEPKAPCKPVCHRCGPGDFEYAEPNTEVNGIKVFMCYPCRQNPWR